LFVRERFDVWAPQIDELLDAVGEIAYVAGGAARQLIMPDAPYAWDIDLFLYDGDDLNRCKDAVRRLGYRQQIYTEHSSEFDPRDDSEWPVQIIEFFENQWSLSSGSPEDVLSHFSFTTEMFAVVRKNGVTEAIVGKDSRAHTESRMLRVQNITDPLIVGLRAVKHAYKGFGISPEELQKIMDEYAVRQRVMV
jgi:hypothetical protein